MKEDWLMQKEDLKRWLKAIAIGLAIFALFSLYLYLRRGYYNIYIINKVLGSSAALLGGVSLVLGPLSKRFGSLAKFMTIRRHLGLLALFLAVTHIILSLSQQGRFPFPDWYLSEWTPVTFGLIAVSLWAYMGFISRDAKIRQMGVELWKKRLSLAGQLAFLAIFFHLTIMKYPGWIRWFNSQLKASSELANPSFPPASLFVFFFMLSVLCYRLVNQVLVSKNGGGKE